jgi:ATP-dependent Clp protease protease subunit
LHDKEHSVAVIPTVIEHTYAGERVSDIYSRLLAARIVMLGTEITPDTANLVVAQLLHLEAESTSKDVQLYINSPGGDMVAMFAIHDAMQSIRCDVATTCIGQSASAAAILLAAGARGKRRTLPNARVLLHQPHGGVQGQSSDLEIAVKEMVEMRTRMVDILQRATGQPRERLERDLDRDFILRGREAVDYGVVDEVLAG